MPFAYSPEYREMELAQVRAGRRVAELPASYFGLFRSNNALNWKAP